MSKKLALDRLQKKRRFRIYFANSIRLLKYPLLILSLYLLLLQKQKLIDPIKNFTLSLSYEYGFGIKEIEITGCENINVQEILSKLNLNSKFSILAVDLVRIQKILLDNQWVNKSIIRRVFPDRLIIEIREKRPIAIWQSNKKFYLIDENGNKITDNIDNFHYLLQIIGEGANIYAAQLIKILADKPHILSNIKHAIWNGLRRWDFILYDGTIVKMPEANLPQAINFLQQQFIEGLLPNNKIKNLDMRNPEKYYIGLE